MALTLPDFVTTRDTIAAIGTNRAPELSPSPDKFMGEQAGALAQHAQSLGADIERVSQDWPPSILSSEEGLSAAGEAIGIDNGTGGFGPRGATTAQGLTAYLTGDQATIYLAGQLATIGGVTLSLRTGVTIPGAGPGTGQVLGTWDAVTVGVAGNLTAGAVLALQSPPGTSDPNITLLTGPAVLGADAESRESIYARVAAKFQRPPNGGNPQDFREWAEGALDTQGNPITTAVLTAYVYPNYDGDGNPLVVLLHAGSGTTRQPPASVLAADQLYINGSITFAGQRPASSQTRVVGGFFPTARELIIKARTIPNLPKFAFDWVRGATVYNVDAFSIAALPGWAAAAQANAVLTLDRLAPMDLKDAITAGRQPRIQVHTLSGAITGPVVPEQWPCVAFLDALGLTSLGLRVPNPTNAASWVNLGNEVFSGSLYVAAIAGRILTDAVDSAGPSRISGLADPAAIWQDVVGSTTVSTAAENALDADGLTRIITRCVAGAVTIAIGVTGADLVQDVQASDNTITGPEVLYAGRVLVID